MNFQGREGSLGLATHKAVVCRPGPSAHLDNTDRLQGRKARGRKEGMGDSEQGEGALSDSSRCHLGTALGKLIPRGSPPTARPDTPASSKLLPYRKEIKSRTQLSPRETRWVVCLLYSYPLSLNFPLLPYLAFLSERLPQRIAQVSSPFLLGFWLVLLAIHQPRF